jgi:hypothetical protein
MNEYLQKLGVMCGLPHSFLNPAFLAAYDRQKKLREQIVTGKTPPPKKRATQPNNARGTRLMRLLLI